MRIGGTPAYVQRPTAEPQRPASSPPGGSRMPAVSQAEVRGGEESRPRHELPRHFALRRALSAYLGIEHRPDPAAGPLGPRIAEVV